MQAQARVGGNVALLITEIMYNPPDLEQIAGSELEFLELHNPGNEPVNLSGMAFTSGISYTFGAGSLLDAGGYLALTSNPAAFQSKYGFAPFDSYDGQLANGGEDLILRTADDAILLTQPYDDRQPWPCGADGSGFSLVLADNATPANATSWRLSTNLGGSPASVDSPPASNLPHIVVNEILAHTDAPLEDAVELHNLGDFDASIGGWYLSDQPNKNPLRMQIDNDAAIPAGGYLVLDETALAAGGFALSENGETLLLSSAGCDGGLTGYREEAEFKASPNGVSMGRYQNSVGDIHYPLQTMRTLGADNAGPRVGPVVISEIMYHPPTGGDEYVELSNITSDPVNLFHPDYPQIRWRLQGISDYTLPPGVSLPARGRLLITPLEPGAFRAKYGVPANVQIFGPYQGELSNGGERITVEWPGNPNSDGSQPYIVMDSVNYGDSAPWPTAPDGNGPALTRLFLTAYGDDPINWRSSDTPVTALYLPIVLGAAADDG